MVNQLSRFYPLPDQFELSLLQYPVLRNAGLFKPIALHPVVHPSFTAKNIRVDILRADQLHPVISGNKWFKLKYHLVQAKREGHTTLISFGGAWSNHLHALAYCANRLGLDCVGIVRGEELSLASNPMLAEADAWGMELKFVSRAQFRDVRSGLRPLLDALKLTRGYVIPEGGDGWLGMVGASTMMAQSIHGVSRYDEVITAVGTGCTFAGLRLGLPTSARLIGYSALRGQWQASAMAHRLQLCGRVGPWQLTDHYCRGGFGRSDKVLLSFIDEFYEDTQVPLEPLYSAKAMMGLMDRVQQQVIKSGSRVLFVHNGGLQGLRGIAPNE